jgi:hypothetical protein
VAQFLQSLIEKLTALDTEIFLRSEAAKGSAARGLATIAGAPGTAPFPDDRLPAGYIRPGARWFRRQLACFMADWPASGQIGCREKLQSGLNLAEREGFETPSLDNTTCSPTGLLYCCE